MARKSDPLSDSFGTDDSDGWLGGLVADEDSFDRRMLWRLGLWGTAAVGALTLGILSAQLPVNAQRAQVAANEFAGRAKQVEATVHESKLEARRLSAAIDTLNGDRDRLFSRLSSLEQNVDMVTGSIARKADDKPAATMPWPDAATARLIDSVPFAIAAPQAIPPQQPATIATAPSEPERSAEPARTEPAPGQTAALAQPPPASPPAVQAMPIPDPQPAAEDTQKTAAEETPVAVAAFGIDLGSANSISGLRALWRGLAKSHKTQLDGLRPLIAVQERRNGLGLQLRLIAGPIKDAAAAARICAALEGANRDCKTATFDGQRLSLTAEANDQAAPAPQTKPRRARARATERDARTSAQRSSALGTMLGIR